MAAGELRLAFDVDHTGASRGHGRGDPLRKAVGQRPRADHCEPVDLADLGSRRSNADLALGDQLAEATGRQVGAPSPTADCLSHVVPGHCAAPSLAGEERGLPGNVGEATETRRQPVAPARDAGAVIGECRHGITRERHERLVAGDSRNHAGVVADRRLVARDGGIEIGQHLEQLPEIRVGDAEELVEAAVADQHHLDVDRDRVGLEERRAEGGGELGRDDLQHARPQAAQQHLPGAGLGKHVARLQNQEAAVCLEQRPPLDRHVVCVRAALGHEIALDLAEEIPERGRALDHDRAAGCGRRARGSGSPDICGSRP